jgi:hypothetical protein
MRASQSQANNLQNTDQSNSANYGSNASNINAQLMPFLTQRLNNPQGYSQGDLGAMLSNALGSSGGATSGITGQANLQAGRTRNAAGLNSALDDAARSRMKTNAGTAEGIAANNAQLKQTQQTDAAKMLSGLYGTNVGAQSDANNNRVGAINAETTAGQSGWLQNMNAILATISGNGAAAAKAVGGG